MLKSMVIFQFSFFFGPELPSLSKIIPKNQNYIVTLKFRNCINLNMLNSMVMFTFLFQCECNVFGQIFFQNSQLCVWGETWHIDYFNSEQIGWWCSVLLFCTRNIVFEKLVPNFQSYKILFKLFNGTVASFILLN